MELIEWEEFVTFAKRIMKQALNQHIDALKVSLTFLSKGKFLGYFIPGIIITLFFLLFDSLINTIFGNTTVINKGAGWFSRSVLKMGSILDVILVQVYIFFILTILSPVNTFLSEKVDEALTGQPYPFNIVRFVNDMVRMVLIVVIALLMQLCFTSIWWLICWILGITKTMAYDVVAFLISAFFFGFSFYDYSLERYRETVSKSLKFAFSNFWTVIFTGILFKLLYHFPYFWDVSYIGIVLAPVISTMVSTIVYLKATGKLQDNTQIERR